MMANTQQKRNFYPMYDWKLTVQESNNPKKKTLTTVLIAALAFLHTLRKLLFRIPKLNVYSDDWSRSK